MKQANQEIRNKAKEKGVKLWQIALRLGCNDGNLSRKLRVELPQEEKDRVFAIIDEIVAQQKETAC